MLYIEKESTQKLPEKYHEIHNICVNLYDQLLEIIDTKSLVQTEFNFDPDKQILINELKNEEIHIIDWLKKNKLNDEIYEVLVKNITRSISADFNNFIYHSLNSAKSGHMTVAYALLRKPLTDELLIFEQLLYDSEEFIERFFWIGKPNKYDPSSRSINKKNIIKNSINTLNLKFLFDIDFIYKLRYDKTFSSGINGISNQALHIVTQDSSYKTLDQNLNFVFSNKDDIDRYWDHFYKTLLYLLIYTYSVIDSILFKFLKDKESGYLRDIRSFYRFNAFLKYTELFVDLKKEYGFKSSKMIVFNCVKCKVDVSFEKADQELFLSSRFIICPCCYTEISGFEKTKKQIQDFIRAFSKS